MKAETKCHIRDPCNNIKKHLPQDQHLYTLCILPRQFFLTLLICRLFFLKKSSLVCKPSQIIRDCSLVDSSTGSSLVERETEIPHRSRLHVERLQLRFSVRFTESATCWHLALMVRKNFFVQILPIGHVLLKSYKNAAEMKNSAHKLPNRFHVETSTQGETKESEKKGRKVEDDFERLIIVFARPWDQTTTTSKSCYSIELFVGIVLSYK